MSIGKRIKEARNAKGYTQEELGNKIGVTKGAIANYENEVSTPRLDLLYNIMKHLEVDANYIYQDEMERLGIDKQKAEVIAGGKSQRIPVVGSIAAGTPTLNEQNVDRYVEIANDVDVDLCFEVRGDSMIGDHILEKDLVFIKKTKDIVDGEIYAIRYENSLTLKRIRKVSEDEVQLISSNHNVPPIVFNSCDDIETIGRYVKLVRYADN